MRRLAAILVALFLGTVVPAQDGVAKPKPKKPATVAELIARYAAAEGEGKVRIDAQLKTLRIIARRDGSDISRFLIARYDEEKIPRLRTEAFRGLIRRPTFEGVGARIIAAARSAGPRGIRAVAIANLSRVAEDWRDQLTEVIRKDPDPSTRNSCINALAAPKDEFGLRALELLYKKGAPANRSYLIQVVSRKYGIDSIREVFIKPNVADKAEPALRQLALQALARHRDESFFRYARKHQARETADWYLASWATWSAPFDTENALKFMLSLIEKVKNRPRTGKAILDGVKVMKSSAVGDYVRKKVIRSKNPFLRLVGISHLSAQPRPEDPAVLIKLARGKDERVAAEATAALGKHPTDEVQKQLEKLIARRNPLLASDALRAWWHQQKGKGRVVLRCLEVARRSRSWEMRMVATDLLGPGHAQIAADVIRGNTTHRTPQVREAAYNAMTYLRTKDSVDLLIERLGSERGRSLYELASALSNLTGFDWGTSQDRWKKWWTRVRGPYELPPRPKGKKKVDPTDSYGRYYGITLRSKNVAFVVDISGSMSTMVKGTAVTRLEQAKHNLIDLVKNFKADMKFNIIAFDQGILAYEQRLVRAKPGARKEAVSWTSNLAPRGSTDIYGALMTALDMEGVDTIFLLSDGAPSAGEVTDTEEILRLVSRRNRFLRCRINTIGIGLAGATKRFMERLASENFGESRTTD